MAPVTFRSVTYSGESDKLIMENQWWGRDRDIVLTAYGTGSPPTPGCDCIYVIRKLPVSFDN